MEDLVYDGKTCKILSGDGTIELIHQELLECQIITFQNMQLMLNPGIKDWKDLNKHKDKFATC
jgi:hypothetical protein